MLLGKRQRPPLKRTTSLSEITFAVSPESAEQQNHHPPVVQQVTAVDQHHHGHNQRLSGKNGHRRHSDDFRETAHFLRVCLLCKRRLVPGRDIYMYRGDSAFCSLECRQRQMAQDERKETNCYVATKKEAAVVTTETAGGETVAV